MPINKKCSFSPKNKKKSDKVEVNPVIKDLPENSAVPAASTNEALNSQQRMRRANQMRRLLPRLRVAQNIAKRRMADHSVLTTRSQKLARRLLKKRFAGNRGYNYHTLGTGEKISVDKMMAGKHKLVKAIATRLFPKVRQAEFVRMGQVRHGKFPKINALRLGMNKRLKGTIADSVLTAAALKSLNTKAEKHNISIDTLQEVYDRGIKSWTDDIKLTPQQFAFNRVNSFLQKGKALEEDKDLVEHMVRTTRWVLVKLKNGRLDLRKITTHKNVPVGALRKESEDIKEYMVSSTKVINVRKKGGGMERRKVHTYKDVKESALIARVRKTLGL